MNPLGVSIPASTEEITLRNLVFKVVDVFVIEGV